MDIIALITKPSSLLGGIERSTLDICLSLANRGHEVSLIYFEAGDLLEKYQKFCRKILKVKNLDVNKKQLIPSTIKFIGNILAVSQQLEIKEKKNTIIYVDHYNYCLFAAVLAWQNKLPSVFHLRISSLTKAPRKHLLGMKLIKQIISVSNQTKLDWVNTGIQAEKISVVYNGINPDFFQPVPNLPEVRNKFNLAPEQKVISYIGRIDQEKGIEILIKSLSLLCQENRTNIKLLIAGRPVIHSSREVGEKYQRSLQELVVNLGIESHVEFLGHVGKPELIYQVSDLTVIPSVYSEPFGRTVIESMSCGVPVLGSKIGGIPEILTGEFARGLFTPGNSESLLIKLQEFLDWRVENPQLGERCRHHVINNFSLEKNVDGVEKVLLEAMK
ncbi:MAG: glycosyltransferase family 4 protein [Okeania sp. SIO3I5]|uniref:glycosyltransferase family 4 protein n=1 Tax=Okeania sp. SIO3I5 TaxID=2607805 RepID=UPI0013BD4D86|nr:glycosyltransferase family 4 protein [Okeania sp. SIO3I5]NEQ39104.1 glycosyltransferase family 4 protein [Okeania sp. SIO3I5]